MWKNKYTWMIVECGRINILGQLWNVEESIYFSSNMECGRINILRHMGNVEEF